jgi:predicted nucleotidyltransferase component of viral defense system
MIDVIKQQFKEGMSNDQKLNVMREFLQILCLKIMDEKKFFDQVAFLGGTSLRILYNIKRFSEDLDFSLSDKRKYNFSEIYEELSRSFALYNLPFEAKPRTETNVHSMMMGFTGLLKALGLSPMQSQKFSIKFEIDTNPPLGWNLANTFVGKFFNFTVTHYDLPSLYAGKLHACFYRKFIKGRDYYDFVWYLTKKVKPNFVLLNNAIKQTQGVDLGINQDNLKTYLLENIERIDFEKVKKDVERFLEDKSELNLFDSRIIRQNIEAVY